MEEEDVDRDMDDDRDDDDDDKINNDKEILSSLLYSHSLSRHTTPSPWSVV